MTHGENPQSRSTAPVFVLGAPRAGTTLLYDMLLSSGGFAVYLAESNVFNMLAPHFGDLSRRVNRQKLMRVWLDTKLFRASGLDAGEIEHEILEQCRNAGDFLRIVMEGIARRQGVPRWAENSSESTLHILEIKRLIPNALLIHMVRDGRDVAMSLNRVNYVRPPLPWQKHISLVGAGIYWEWIVERGYQHGQQFAGDYLKVRFEDLIASPREMLRTIGTFLDHELDYDRILQVGYGSVSKPNTSFRSDSKENFNPIGRWKKGFSGAQLLRFESMVGSMLLKHGYALGSGQQPKMNWEMRATRWLYRTFFESKQRVKRSLPYRRLHPLTAARINAVSQAENHPPQLKAAASPQSTGSSR